MARYDSPTTFFDAGICYDEPDPVPATPMSQNLISQTMTDVQRDALLTDLTSFDTKFAAYKSTLTPKEIAHLAKLGAADIAYLDLALTFAQQNPTAIPGNINLAEFVKDLTLAKQLAMVNARVEQLANQTRTSLIAVMSDGFAAARLVYRVAQAQGRTPETTAFLDAFGKHFAVSAAAPAAPATPAK